MTREPMRAQTDQQAACDPEQAADRERNVWLVESTPAGHDAGAGPLWLVAGIAGLVTLALLAVALAVHFVSPASARALLEFRFPAGHPGPAAAWGIFAANARLAGAPLGGALLLAITDGGTRAFGRVRALIDTSLAAVVAINVIIVGGSFGAYGTRMLAYTLPHGPVELGGYCCALALYACARTQRLHVRAAWVLAAATVLLLLCAAILEALASPI